MTLEAVKPAVKGDDEFLSADGVIGTNDIEYDTIPAWGGKLRIQSLTAGDLIEWSEANDSGEAKRTAGLRLIVKSAVDKDGKLIFIDKHIAKLREKSHKETEKVVKGILKLNAMLVKSQDTAAKND